MRFVLLAFFNSYDKDLEQKLNFLDNIKTLNDVLRLWEFRGLTLAGRILVFKSLALSKLLYACTMKVPGKFVIDQLHTLHKHFIWNNKRPKIKHSTLIADYCEGGYKEFCQELIQIWAKASGKEPSRTSEICEEVLWNNKMIASNGDSLFDKHFILKDILTMRDIIDEYGVSLSWQDVQQKYSLNGPLVFRWYGLIKSISTTWKDELQRNIPHSSENNRNEHCIITSKTAYQKLLKPITKPPTVQNSLINLLGLTDINWKKVYMLPRQATIESSLRSFQYKILNNILYLNEKLFKFKMVDSPLCSLCETENESVPHLFCECAVTSNLLEQFRLRVSDISLFGKIDIDPQTIIFGAWNLNKPDFILINHMILLFKRYIYLRRHDRHGPNITGLKSFTKHIETVECRIAFDKEKLSFHYKKWETLLPFL